MGWVVLVIFVVALVLMGVGFAIGLVACFLAAVLLGMGVVSSSFVIGLRSGRSADGIRAFFLQCGILSGIPAGAVGACLGQYAFASFDGGRMILLWGGLGGALAGALVGLLLDQLSRRLHQWALDRIKPPRGTIEGGSEP